MFYPIQSIGYTWSTSKKIYEVFCGYSLKLRLLIFSCVGALLATAVLYYSLWFGILFGILLWISMIDLYDRIIPDILLLGILLNLWMLGTTVHATSLIFAAGLILIKLGLETYFKKNIIGWGDIKLLTLCLVFTPLSYLPALLFISGGVGLVLALLLRSKSFPFAPAIIIGFLSTYLA